MQQTRGGRVAQKRTDASAQTSLPLLCRDDRDVPRPSEVSPVPGDGGKIPIRAWANFASVQDVVMPQRRRSTPCTGANSTRSASRPITTITTITPITCSIACSSRP